MVAYTVSQLSISPENTIFHFLHLDVGEVTVVQIVRMHMAILETPG